MAQIVVKNMSFSYDGFNNIFENVSFNLDTKWKLGLIGRNGKGKSTFLNLLLGKYDYEGTITSNVNYEYFPYKLKNENEYIYNIINEYNIPDWKFKKEILKLELNENILYRKFNYLSKGEQIKILLSILFLKENNFLLIDEPTNHLDFESRNILANYLNTKEGFILVSHDRNFLDKCVDHILSINRNTIYIEQGNFTSWWNNKEKKDLYEINTNEKLKKNIKKLEESSKRYSSWSDKTESSKYNFDGDGMKDTGFISKKATKLMKLSKNAENRKNKLIEEKKKLLKDVEEVENLKLHLLKNKNKYLIEFDKVSLNHGEKEIFNNLSFILNDGDRIWLKGKNGTGKTSIIKLILGENIHYEGNIYKVNNLKISYVSQDTSFLKGSLNLFIKSNNLDEVLFKSILRKLNFERTLFNNNLEDYSEGEKKKILIVKSLSEDSNILIYDEPLNYIDIYSRIQIENLILKYKPTMIFVEHDEAFSNNIKTKKIELK